MSRTLHTLTYTILVEDVEHWASGTVSAANHEITSGTYDDWAVEALNRAMRAAGQQFIDAHPDLFAEGLL